MRFKTGDIVVIDHIVEDDCWEWIPAMTKLLGATGIVEEADDIIAGYPRGQSWYVAVQTYENGPGVAFVYHEDALRKATPAEVAAFTLVHYLRKIDV